MSIEAPHHIPFDFANLPLTNEQKILACLERIEVLLTPAFIVNDQKVSEAVVAVAQPAEKAAPRKPLGRK